MAGRGDARTGIVVAQLGGPGDVREVEPFIRAVFADPAVVPMPGGRSTRRVLGWAIAKARGRSVRARYRQIGGGSPIRDITLRQAAALEESLRRRGHDVSVAVAMRHSRPDTSDAVGALLSDDVGRLLLLPLFPQYSFATTGSAETELRRVLGERRLDLPVAVIRSWCDHPAYLDATAVLVSEAVAGMRSSPGSRTVLLFSAHGLPQRLVERGDPYPDEIEATVTGVTDRLGDVETCLAYQSRAGPIRWIGPGTDDVLRELPGEGPTAVIVVPISFVSDHIETLHEIDVDLRRVALEAGIEHFSRSPVLNDRQETGSLLADVAEQLL